MDYFITNQDIRIDEILQDSDHLSVGAIIELMIEMRQLEIPSEITYPRQYWEPLYEAYVNEKDTSEWFNRKLNTFCSKYLNNFIQEHYPKLLDFFGEEKLYDPDFICSFGEYKSNQAGEYLNTILPFTFLPKQTQEEEDTIDFDELFKLSEIKKK